MTASPAPIRCQPSLTSLRNELRISTSVPPGYILAAPRIIEEIQNCPLPTPEDRLLFLLAYVKTYSLQVVQGRLFGMGQSKANQWIHVLLPVLLTALRTLDDAPARSLRVLAQRLGVTEADAAAVVTPLAEEPAPVGASPTAEQACPLLPTTRQ